MKPFLGIDITENKKNDHLDGEEFIVATVSSAQSQHLENAVENAVDLLQKSKLPLPIRIGHWICGAVGGLVVCGIFKVLIDEDSVSLSQAYINAPWLFWLAGSCLLIWLILTVISRKKQSDVLESDESSYVSSRLDTISDNIYAELGVPANAPAVDILSFRYKLKNGVPVAKERGMDMTAYDNFENRIFVQDGQLFIADLENKYAFPISGLRAIRTIKKSITIPDWNKDDSPNEGIYKSYKLDVDKYDHIHLKPYHILEIEHNGEIWDIYFPCYELPAFEALTGLTAE